MEVRVVPAGAVELSILEAGRGGRPLLLVHGFTGAKEDFADWLDLFAEQGWWVVAPDLRGHGASSAPAGESSYSLATFAADLVALLDELGWASCALLGHSMGGMVAQQLVLDHPELVERLVLMDTDHGPVDGLDPATVALGVDLLRAEGLPALLDLLASLPQQRAEAEERLRSTRPGYIEWSEAKVRACSPAMYAAMAVALSSRPDRLAAAAAIDVPTLVVVGEQDRTFRPACERLAAAIPGADLVVVPAAAHSPQLEHPEAWWAAVAPFLASALPAAVPAVADPA